MKMESIEQDPRFAHVASDPRFKPMPKSKKKVKIDSRFQSLFTNKHFSHRTDMDKRGRPALNRSQKNKSTMEQFYEMSSESSAEETSSESDGNEQEIEDAPKDNNNDSIESNQTSLSKLPSVKEKKKKSKIINKDKSKSDDLELDIDVSENGSVAEKANKRKRKSESNLGERNLKKKKSHVKKTDQQENSDVKSDESDESENEVEPLQRTEENDDDLDSDDEEELPMYTEEYDLEETDHQWNELEKDAPLSDEASHRFAVCNMDWDFVKAQDLFVLFKSFVPEGGSVKSVAIYPSEFGKERMAEEVKLGPKEIREHTQKVQEDKASKKKGGKKIDEKKEKDLRKTKEEIQTEKLREYQLNRLKYYYAVVVCDSIKTADTIYTECDGREYQLSSVRLDLRFIPDDMTFDDDPREIFSEQQTIADYQPSSFESSALCNAKVEVTWDETEFDRLSRRVGVMQQKDLESIIEENKYADIIAPPESDSDEEEEGRPDWLVEALAQDSEEDDEQEDSDSGNIKEKTVSEEKKIKLYRKLLIDKATEEEEAEKDEKDVDKVIEWTPGVSKSDVKKKLKKKEKSNEETAVVNDYLEKRREKKKKKRDLKKQKDLVEEGDALNDDEDDDFNDVDDSIKKMMEGEEVFDEVITHKKKKKNKKTVDNENEDDDKERAELELMLMDDEDTKHFSKPVIVDDNESKSKKKRKSKKAMAKQKMSKEQVVEKDDYVMDVDDNRFSALYSSHHFHIDPTAPQFKKTKNMMRLVDEQIKRKKSGKKEKTVSNNKTTEGEKSSKSVSQSLVESLKKKMKKS